MSNNGQCAQTMVDKSSTSANPFIYPQTSGDPISSRETARTRGFASYKLYFFTHRVNVPNEKMYNFPVTRLGRKQKKKKVGIKRPLESRPSTDHKETMFAHLAASSSLWSAKTKES